MSLGNARCRFCGRSHRIESMVRRRPELDETTGDDGTAGHYIDVCQSCDRKAALRRKMRNARWWGKPKRRRRAA